MADPKRTMLLVDAQSRGRRGILRALVKAVTGMFQRATEKGLSTDDDAQRLVTAMLDPVRTARTAEADLTWSYLDGLLNQGGIAPTPRTKVDLTGLHDRPDHDVWSDPIAKYMATARSDATTDAAMEKALSTLETIAAEDMALAMQRTAHAHAAATPRVRGLRRVVHPELSKGGTCGLCIVATDQIYKVQELKPIHERCQCTVAEIVGDHDPGSSLNNLDLAQLYANAGESSDSAPLKRTRYKATAADEWEAVKVVKPKDDDEKAASRRAQPTRSTADPGNRVAAINRSIKDLIARKATGEDVSLQLARQYAVLNKELARLRSRSAA